MVAILVSVPVCSLEKRMEYRVGTSSVYVICSVESEREYCMHLSVGDHLRM
jgi:hypothetical protein